MDESEVLKDQEPDRDVMKNFYRVKAAEILNEARTFADMAKYEKAKKLFLDFKEELENSFLKNEAFIRDLIADIERALKEVQPDAYQYGGCSTIGAMSRAHMYQQSNFTTIGAYQNPTQERMIRSTLAMKANK